MTWIMKQLSTTNLTQQPFWTWKQRKTNQTHHKFLSDKLEWRYTTWHLQTDANNSYNMNKTKQAIIRLTHLCSWNYSSQYVNKFRAQLRKPFNKWCLEAIWWRKTEPNDKVTYCPSVDTILHLKNTELSAAGAAVIIILIQINGGQGM